MGGKKKNTGKRAYVGLEPALTQANKNYLISCNKLHTNATRVIVEQIVKKIIDAMKKQSPTFACLYRKNFGGGSIYDGLKIGKADEFDIDILLEMPDIVKPVLVEDSVAGFAQLQLKNFHNLAKTNAEAYKVIGEFLDENNYLLPKKMKSSFMQSIFDRTVNNYFPNGSVKIGKKTYKISRVQHLGPAFTLTLDGPNLNAVAVDLVPSILLTSWPKQMYRKNPYPSRNEFFLAPTTPKQEHPHKERFWRLSFHMQERQMIFNKFWLKPAIKALKRLRDHFGHSIRSYAIKTVFLWELYSGNPRLDDQTPDLFKGSLSFVVIYMLEKYVSCLRKAKIPDFWNPDLNLLCHLSKQQLEQYVQDVSAMYLDIKSNKTSTTLLKYLE